MCGTLLAVNHSFRPQGGQMHRLARFTPHVFLASLALGAINAALVIAAAL